MPDLQRMVFATIGLIILESTDKLPERGHNMSKKFASQADLEQKAVSFDRLAEGVYAYTAEGDPNTGIIIGDDGVMVIDTQATPIMAQY